MMKEVFISYKSEEFEEASWVKSVLENNGISCWMAPESIPGGSNYAMEIPKAIKECKAFVLILSSKSQSSQWVSREVDRAINEGKIVLPFMLENCELADDFNFYLTNVQRYTAYINKTKAIEKMLREIKAILQANASVEDKQEIVNKDVENDEKKVVEQSVKKGFKLAEKIKKRKTNKTESNFKKEIKEGKTFKNFFKSKKNVVIFGFAAFLVVFVGLAVLLNVLNKVTIAGKRISKDNSYLNFEDVTITAEDMEKFYDFENLSFLYFTNCTFETTDVSAVFCVPDLILSLDNCGITNEQLKSVDYDMVALSTLKLDNNKAISDLSLFNNLTTLDELSINNCSVSDISFLTSSYDLCKFSADDNKIVDITSLKEREKLEYLSLENNEVETLEPLANLKNIKYININGNKIKYLRGLENSLFLESLYAGNNEIYSIEGLKNCTQLQKVNLSNNKIINILHLSKSAEKLVSIDLSGNYISDLSALSGTVNLEELYLDNNDVVNLNSLEKSTKISKLSASNNQINDINGITKCIFKKINLSNNQLTSMAGITFAADDTYGAQFDVSNNKITEFALNAEGSGSLHFSDIRLQGNVIADFSDLKKVELSELVINYNENIDFSKLAEYEIYTYYILDCPLDKQVSIGEQLGKYNTYFLTQKEFLQMQNEK